MSNKPVDSFRRVATRLVGAGRKGVVGAEAPATAGTGLAR